VGPPGIRLAIPIGVPRGGRLAVVAGHCVVPQCGAARGRRARRAAAAGALSLRPTALPRGWPLAAAMFVWLIDMERLTFEIRKVVVY
jgi:hypothetical protein